MPDCEKIVCSKGTFDSVKDFMEFLGISKGSFYNYRWIYEGYTKEEFYERIILASDLKKKYNLRTLPMQEDIVLYKGEYYPNINYVAKGIGVSKDTLRRKLREGYSTEDAVKYCEESAKNQKIKEEKAKLISILKSGEDEKSRVYLRGNNITKIVVDGVTYTDIGELVKDYKTSQVRFISKVKEYGSIYKALNDYQSENIRFLGRVFKDVDDICSFYKIDKTYWDTLVKKYKINYLEDVFKCAIEVVEETNYSGRLEYLIKTSKDFYCNKDDVLYQLKNKGKVEKGYKYYLGGKSYKGLNSFYLEYGTSFAKTRSSLYFLLALDNTSIYKVADFLSNKGYVIAESDPIVFIYMYFKDMLDGKSPKNIVEFSKSVKKSMRNGLTIEEVKERLNAITNLLNIVYGDNYSAIRMTLSRYSGTSSVSEDGIRNIFNESSLETVKRFMVYSDVTVMKKSYRVGSISYYFCMVGDSVEYLSGDELLEISLKSIENIEVKD